MHVYEHSSGLVMWLWTRRGRRWCWRRRGHDELLRLFFLVFLFPLVTQAEFTTVFPLDFSQRRRAGFALALSQRIHATTNGFP